MSSSNFCYRIQLRHASSAGGAYSCDESWTILPWYDTIHKLSIEERTTIGVGMSSSQKEMWLKISKGAYDAAVFPEHFFDSNKMLIPDVDNFDLWFLLHEFTRKTYAAVLKKGVVAHWASTGGRTWDLIFRPSNNWAASINNSNASDGVEYTHWRGNTIEQAHEQLCQRYTTESTAFDSIAIALKQEAHDLDTREQAINKREVQLKQAVSERVAQLEAQVSNLTNEIKARDAIEAQKVQQIKKECENARACARALFKNTTETEASSSKGGKLAKDTETFGPYLCTGPSPMSKTSKKVSNRFRDLTKLNDASKDEVEDTMSNKREIELTSKINELEVANATQHRAMKSTLSAHGVLRRRVRDEFEHKLEAPTTIQSTLEAKIEALQLEVKQKHETIRTAEQLTARIHMMVRAEKQRVELEEAIAAKANEPLYVGDDLQSGDEAGVSGRSKEDVFLAAHEDFHRQRLAEKAEMKAKILAARSKASQQDDAPTKEELKDFIGNGSKMDIEDAGAVRMGKEELREAAQAEIRRQHRGEAKEEGLLSALAKYFGGSQGGDAKQ